MKLVTFMQNGNTAVGLVGPEDASVYPIPGCADMTALIRGWAEFDAEAAERGTPIPMAEVELLAPIPHPAQDIICLGINYFDHAKESEAVAPGGCIDSHSDIVADLDYEAELAVVIGRDAYNVCPDEALDYVFGYTVLNDVSARTIQNQHKQWYRGKSLDGFTPIGPWIVTADSFPVDQPMKIQSFVNGEIRQNSSIDLMIFHVAYVVSELSHGMTLTPGTIISMGTPAGVGMGFQPPKYMKPGDVVECFVEGIGTLKNTVR